MFHVWCMLGWQRFVVQSVNGINSVACPDGWSADDRNVCHARKGIRRVLQVGRMGFLITTVCFFLMSVFAGESKVSSNTLLRRRPVVR